MLSHSLKFYDVMILPRLLPVTFMTFIPLRIPHKKKQKLHSETKIFLYTKLLKDKMIRTFESRQLFQIHTEYIRSSSGKEFYL